MMRSPTYTEVSSIVQNLSHATKATDRRNAASKLTSLLENTNIRAKLLSESLKASSASSTRANNNSNNRQANSNVDPKDPIRKLYRHIIDVAVTSSDNILKTTKSYTNEDVNLPFKLLKFIDCDSDIAHNDWKKRHQENTHYQSEPFTFQSFDRYRDTDSHITYLSSKNILTLLIYCLNILKVERYKPFHSQMLTSLAQLCSRADYVCHFDPREDVGIILDVLASRLASTSSSSSNTHTCAKIFHSLIHHCTITLKVQINSHLMTSLKIIQNWIQSDTETNNNITSASTLCYMYGAVVDLFSTHPYIYATKSFHDSISIIWAFAKRSWGLHRTVRQNRDVLVDFFSAHLLLCEVAGKLQGLFPGDLGDIGSSSLDNTKILDLLNLLLSEKPEKQIETKLKLNGTDDGMVMKAISKRQRRYLELVSRLLRCAQRDFLVYLELSLTDNPTGALIAEYQRDVNLYDGLKCIGKQKIMEPTNFNKSPWVQFVCKFLVECNTSNTHSSSSQISESVSDGGGGIGLEPYQRTSLATSTNNIPCKTDRDKSFIPYLQIIAACAELFPRGECWSFSNTWFKNNYSPLEINVDDRKRLSYCNCCAPQDISSVVKMMTSLLLDSGGPSGDIETQKWTIICLLKLTESSMIICRYWGEDDQNLSLLGDAWKDVWNTILRTDLRYLSYTKDAYPSSIGELVLMLLTEIVKCCLTNPTSINSYLEVEGETLYDYHDGNRPKPNNNMTFIHEQQSKIWNLPIFRSPGGVKTSAIFELATVIISYSGLLERGSDAINLDELEDILNIHLKMKTSDLKSGRRYRLCYFSLSCIHYLITSSQILDAKRILPFISSFLCVLTGTKNFIPVTSYSMNSFRNFRCTEDVPVMRHNLGCDERKNHLDIFGLWEDSFFPFEFQHEIENDTDFWCSLVGQGHRLCAAWSYDEMIWVRQTQMLIRRNTNLNFVPFSVAMDLIGSYLRMTSFVTDLINNGDDEIDFSNLSCSFSILKLLLSVLFSHDERSEIRSNFLNLEDFMMNTFDRLLQNMDLMTGEQEIYALTLLDVLGIIRIIKISFACSIYMSILPRLFSFKIADNLYEKCQNAMILNTRLKNYRSPTVERSSVIDGRRNNESRTIDIDSFSSDASASPNRKNSDSDISSFGDVIQASGSKVMTSRKRNRGNETGGHFDSNNSILNSDTQTLDARMIISRKRPRSHNTQEEDTSFPETCLQNFDGKGAWLCSYIIVLLEQSKKSCTFVIDKLLWSHNTLHRTADPHDCLLALALFLKFSVGGDKDCYQSLSDGVDEISTLSLCTQVIYFCRSLADNSSPFHMIGFQACSQLLSKRTHEASNVVVNIQERNDIIAVLHPAADNRGNKSETKRSLKSIKFRPYLRYQQIRAALFIFNNCDDDFHSQFDSIFASSFVMPSLEDDNQSVRHIGIASVGYALKFLPIQEKIASDALATFSLNDVRKNGSTQVITREPSIGYNCKICIQHDYLRCLSVIGGFTSDVSISMKMMKLLVEIAVNEPHLELPCLNYLEQLAYLKSYNKLENMLRTEMTFLLECWLQSKRKFQSIPLLLSSPGILRCISRLHLLDQTNTFQLDRGSLLDESICEYLHDVGHILLPLIMVSEEKIYSEGKVDTDKDEYLFEVAEYLIGSRDDSSVIKLLRVHLHQIFAYAFHIVTGNLNIVESIHKREWIFEVLNIKHLFRTEDNVLKILKRSSSEIVRLLLNRITSNHVFNLDEDVDTSTILRDIHLLGTFLFDDKSSTNDIFQYVGSSLVETLLHVRSDLQLSHDEITKDKNWQLIRIIHRIALDQLGESGSSRQVVYSTNAILSLLLDQQYSKLRVPILKELKVTLNKMDSKKSSSAIIELRVVLEKFILFLIVLHQRHMHEFVQFCFDAQFSLQIERRMTIGLISALPSETYASFDVQDTNSKLMDAINHYSKDIPDHIITIMTETYDMLELLHRVFSDEDVLIHSLIQVATTSMEYANTLEKFNEKFVLSSLISKWGRRNSLTGIDIFLRTIQQLNFNSILNSESISTHPSSVSSKLKKFSTAAQLQLSVLRCLKISLKEDMNGNENNCRSLQTKEYYSVFHELTLLCGNYHPTEIRVLASECLGLLATRTNLSESLICSRAFTNNIASLSLRENILKNLDDPLVAIQLVATEMLIDYTLSDDVETALTANETLKILFCGADGGSLLDRIGSEHLRERAAPFLFHRKSSRLKSFTLSNKYLEYLLCLVGKSKEQSHEPGWCWNDELWCPHYKEEKCVFDWIRDIVCSLLFCCYLSSDHDDEYRNKRNASVKGSVEFFSKCAKMCEREPQFAKALFPGIIYDLLVSDDFDDEKAHDKGSYYRMHKSISIGSPSSLANQSITYYFKKILKQYDDYVFQRGSKYNSVTDILIQVVEFLRCISENRFYSKTKTIKSNEMTLRNKRRVEDSECASAWRGRPYGVVLDLDGFEVALACLSVRNVLSAMYYGEMVADNQLGSAGNTFERLYHLEMKYSVLQKPDYHSCSGFGVLSSNEDQSIKDTIDKALRFQGILHRCYEFLQEYDALDGLEKQIYQTTFSRNDNFGNEVKTNFKLSTAADIGNSILNLDVNSHKHINRNTSEYNKSLAMVTLLGDLGMRDTARCYIAGLRNLGDSFSSNFHLTTDLLQEKWAEETWRILQWDESLLTEVDSNNISTTLGSAYRMENLNKDWFDSNAPLSQRGNFFHVCLKESIFSLLQGDETFFMENAVRARRYLLDEVNDLLQTSIAHKSAPDFALKFFILNEIDDLGKVIFRGKCKNDWMSEWCGLSDKIFSEEMNCFTFKTLEFAFSMHELVLKVLYHQRSEVCDLEKIISHLSDFTSLSIEHGRTNIAKAALKRWQSAELVRINDDYVTNLKNKMRFHLENARIDYSTGEFAQAITSAKLIVRSLKDIERTNDISVDFILAQSLIQCTNWLASHKIDSATTIINEYGIPATKLAKKIHTEKNSSKSNKLMVDAHFALAEFTANLYSNTEKRVGSGEWKSFKIAAQGRQKELCSAQSLLDEVQKSLNTKKNKGNKQLEQEWRNIVRHKQTLQREVDHDMKEISTVELAKVNYLKLAVDSYGVALSHTYNSSGLDKYVFRMFSLWFQNCKVNSINIQMNENLKNIPSFHFILVIYQIFSRLDVVSDTASTDFQLALRDIVSRICKDHPYHGLVPLIALSNGTIIGKDVSEDYNINAEKVNAANDVIHGLQKCGPQYVCNLVDSYKKIIDSYIDLAMAPVSTLVESKKTKNIPFASLLKGRKTLDRYKMSSSPPCVLTKPPAIRPGLDYGAGTEDPIGSERVDHFEPVFSLTDTGIHRPKIIKCVGTKGGIFKQLVKGEDDIRQDAIMQQVFATVNNLLRHQKKKNNDHYHIHGRYLKVVGYSCVPLSPTSGVIEWVDDTIPFGDYLLNTNKGRNLGAHARYFPGEWDNSLCRSEFMNAPADQKRYTLDEIFKNFSPAFRFFFLEKFSSSIQDWHEARMNYVRSIAVNSIVGHILGIGDRHSHNILIHEKNGEVVHIDFGIVFEQGKLLNIPEIVPFRLTRDIVDGMGPIGTEGTFTSAALATMRVLRENSNSLLTILSAVVSDPLYKWSINPIRARQHQRRLDNLDDSQDVEGYTEDKVDEVDEERTEQHNESATRALALINEKLLGYEEGESGEMQTIEGQVRLLINAARDPDNLCEMYHGWAPWL